MKHCKQCRYEYEDRMTACPDCGSELAPGPMVVCAQCNEPVGADALFCPHCGAIRNTLVCDTHEGRPAVGRCVVCGRILCNSCVRTRNGRMFCDNDEHVKTAFNWVRVHTAGTEYEAEMLRTNLESAGIPAMVLHQRDSMYVTTLAGLAVLEIMVPRESVEEAARFLQTLDTGAGALPQSDTPP